MTKVSSQLRRRPNGFYEVGVLIGQFGQWHWVQLKARRSDVAKREAPKGLAALLYARAREWDERAAVMMREADALRALGVEAGRGSEINGRDLEGALG